jgi:formate hydrogenlyase transcriptional activator
MQTHPEYDLATSGNELQNEMAERLQFETLLTAIAARFVSLPADRIDAAIIDSQRQLCDFLGVDRSVIWQFLEEKPEAMLLSHIHGGSEGFLPDAPVDFENTFPLVFERIQQGEVFTMKRTKDLQSEAECDCASFTQWGIKSCFMANSIGNRSGPGLRHSADYIKPEERSDS